MPVHGNKTREQKNERCFCSFLVNKSTRVSSIAYKKRVHGTFTREQKREQEK
jgi:hypothetical protein